jgi:hypothetical protein
MNTVPKTLADNEALHKMVILSEAARRLFLPRKSRLLDFRLGPRSEESPSHKRNGNDPHPSGIGGRGFSPDMDWHLAGGL